MMEKLRSFSNNRINKALLVLITLFFVIIYFPYIKHDPFLKRDDFSLVSPLTKINGVSDYIQAVKSNEIQDLQPVRDFSYFLNIKIDEWFELKTFHLTNLFLMVCCIHLLFKIFSRLKWSTGEIIAGVLLFSCHPILVSAIGWISTRKHILGLMFILLAINEILKKEKLSKTSVIYYLLSTLSHPIFILFPAWVLLFLKLRKFPVSWLNFIVMTLSGASVLAVAYYKAFTLQMGNATYVHISTFENVSRFILSSGRAAMVLLFPNVISHSYYQGSIYNLIGIGVLIIVLYLLYKSPSRKECFLWIALAAISLFPTYTLFVNDTYLYLALMCLVICLVILVRPFSAQKRIIITTISVVLLTVKTVSVSGMWLSDLHLWQYSYEQEKAPQAALFLGKQLIDRNPKLALEFIEVGAKGYDLIADVYMLIFFLTTIKEADIPLERKISILEESYFDQQIYNGMYGLVLIEGNKDEEAKGLFLLKRMLLHGNNFNPKSIEFSVVEGIRGVCKKAPEKSYLCKELKISYE